MAQKKDILDYLSQLDENNLNRVYEYARTAKMLYPESDLLLNANMGQMLQKADELAQLYLPDWTDRSDGDFGQFLVELVALFSEKDFWYTNAFHLEGNLSTAKKYSNVFTKAHQRGYDASVLTAPYADFSVTFTPLAEIGNPAFKLLPSGSLVLKRRGGTQEFTNVEPIKIEDSLNEVTKVLRLHKGKYRSSEYVFNGDSIYIDRANIDPQTVAVTIDNVAWERVNQFGLSGPNDKVFVVFPEERGRISIYFGTGTFGKKPELGQEVTVGLLTTDGVNSSILGDFDARNYSPARPVGLVSSLVDTCVGGRISEDIETIRQKAILYGRSRDTIINVDDCIAYLRTLPEIRRAFAIFTNTHITIYGVNRDGEAVDTAVMNSYIPEIEARMVQLGFTVGAGAPSFVTLPAMDIKVECLPQSNYAAAKKRVQQAAKDFYDPLVFGDFGRPFIFNDFYLHLAKADPNIVRLRIDYAGTTNQLPETLPLLPQEIIATPSVLDGAVDQNLFITAASI